MDNRVFEGGRTYLLQMMRELNKVTDGSQVLTVLRIVLQPANHTLLLLELIIIKTKNSHFSDNVNLKYKCNI